MDDVLVKKAKLREKKKLEERGLKYIIKEFPFPLPRDREGGGVAIRCLVLGINHQSE